MSRHPNASRADIIAMLSDGHSNARIVRELRVDRQRVRRIRTELGLPTHIPIEQTRTLEEKWALDTRPLDDGHLEWTGEHATGGTPLVSYKDKHRSAAAVAFRIRTGRDPQGYAIADCGMHHCVAPEHVNDEAGRQQARQKLRAERGLGAIPAKCVSGHDQAEHGKFEPDGTAYCGMCKVLDKRAQRGDPAAARRTKRRPATLKKAYERHAKPVEGGHIRWAGPTSYTTPTVWFDGATYSAYRTAFRLHHGREPEGTVTSGCEMPQCVAGAHVEDRPMRDRKRQEERQARQREKQIDRMYAGIFGAAA
jgi:hypothetical protein